MAGWPIYVDGELVGTGVYAPNRFKYVYDSDTGILRFVNETGELVIGMERVQLDPNLTKEQILQHLHKGFETRNV